MAPALNPGWALSLVSSTLTSSAQYHREDSPSGLWRRLRNPVGHRVPREFDSHILRFTLCFTWASSVAGSRSSLIRKRSEVQVLPRPLPRCSSEAEQPPH